MSAQSFGPQLSLLIILMSGSELCVLMTGGENEWKLGYYLTVKCQYGTCQSCLSDAAQHRDKSLCMQIRISAHTNSSYIYAQHEWQYNVTLLCFTHGYIYTVLLRSILPTLVLSLTLWLFGFPRTACEPGRRSICYTQTHSRPQSPLCFPSRTTLGEKKPKTTTLSIPFITAVWATGCTTAPENVVKMMIQIHILQLTLLLPIFSTWFAVFRKRERRRVCQGACRNKDLQFGNCQCCLLTVNVPPFVYGMDMADVHSAS